MKASKRLLHYRGLITVCDESIRAGRLAEAEKLLLEVSPGNVPRPFLAELAKLCRRCGLNSFGARLLYPVVRADRRKHGPPTDAEICEYATLISRLGYTQQALKLLEGVKPDRFPEALLLRGYCYVSLWDYAAAAPLFAQYLQHPIDSYARLVAQINMAAALIETERLDEARAALEEAMTAARAANARRLLANGHEMSGRIHMASGLWERAEAEFNQARELLGKSQSLDQLLIEKNLAWMDAKKTSRLAPLMRFRRLAEQRRHWDSVREADRLTLHIKFDAPTFDQLVIGSPRAAYRGRVLAEFQRQPSSSFLLGGETSRVFDLESGLLQDHAVLKPGQKIHRLLAVLARDFYAPRSIGEIFSELYQDELYDADHSAFRVAQVIHRTRDWIHEMRLPLEIIQTDGFYRLRLGEGFAIRVPFTNGGPDALHGTWQRLGLELKGRENFTLSELCSMLGISRTQGHRLVREFLKSGRLIACGQGRSTFYSLASRSQAA